MTCPTFQIASIKDNRSYYFPYFRNMLNKFATLKSFVRWKNAEIDMNMKVVNSNGSNIVISVTSHVSFA